MRTHSLKALAILVCLLLLPAALVIGGGQQEASLSDVQRLMDQLDYPGALKLLAKIQREHPDQRDETQRLITMIISNQGKEYNQVLTRLIHVLYVDEDADAALPLIDTLRRLDPYRSKGEAQKSLLYVKFLKLMDSAAALLNEGKVPEAIDLYLSPFADPARAGFDMDKPAFDAAGYGDIVAASVRDAVARIVDAGTQARNEAPAVRGAQSALGSVVTSTPGPQTLARLDEGFAPLALVRQQEQAVLSSAAALDDVSKAIGESAQGTAGESYLRYVSSITRGRKGKPPEGLARAVAMLWEPAAESTASAAAGAAASSYSEARKLFDQGDLAGAEPKLHEAYDRGVLAVKAGSFMTGALHPSAGWVFSASDSTRLTSLLGRISQSQETAAEAAALLQLISYERRAQALPAEATLDAQALAAARAQEMALHDEALGAGSKWQARASELAQQQLTGPALGPLIDGANAMARRFDSFTAQLSQKDLAYAVALARSGAAQFGTRLSDEVKLRMDGMDTMNGTVNGKQPAQDVFVERKPGAALKSFNDASSALDQLTADIAEFRTKLSGPVATNPTIADILANLDTVESKVRTESSEVSRLAQLAEQQHEQALTKRKEADLAFADGSQALAAKQYDGAKLQLGDARDLYLDSLLLEEDPEARKRYTAEIPALIERVNNAIVEKYIADVDAQVSEGRRLFSNGEFLKSFLTLEAAQGRWRATLGDRPNSDLDALLDRVRNALRVSGGRDLAPDDSRAPVINGFLNIANDKAGSAEKLQKNDPRRKQLLDEAYDNVMSALDVDPVYRNAKALQLRIRKLQAKDDTAFRAEAKAEIDSIIDEYHNKKGQPERLYFALKDYQDILPDYQPLRSAIQELEISLNLRIRPPSDAEIAGSNKSLADAEGIYNPGDSNSYGTALADLDTAIRLNPSNERAKALRRAILQKEGSPEASGIPAGDLARFAESKRLYNTEDYAGAYSILASLVSDKRNASYPPLAQLYLLTQQKLGLR